MEWWLHAYEHWLLLQKTHVGSQHSQGTASSVAPVLKAPTPTNGLHRLHAHECGALAEMQTKWLHTQSIF